MSQEAHAEQKILHHLSLLTLLQHGSPDACAKAATELEKLHTSNLPFITPDKLTHVYNNTIPF